MQNMLLLAHALGLGAVWLTFTERQIAVIRDHFHVADYIDVVSYIGLGWPTVQPLAPGRMEPATYFAAQVAGAWRHGLHAP